MAEYQGIDIIESRSDPRDSSRVTKMRIVPISSDDLPPDYYALMAVMFAFFAMISRVKLYAWLTLLFSLASVANQRYSSLDPKLLFSTLTLIFLTFLSTHSAVTGHTFKIPGPWAP